MRKHLERVLHVRAITQNGFWIDVNTVGGNDVISGPTVANTGLAGGAGAEYIVTRSSTGTFAFGGSQFVRAFSSCILARDGHRSSGPNVGALAS
jgi:hypothetical protein